jgi:hypothetical protein
MTIGGDVWKCFHCGETFTDTESARLHFGDNCLSDPACQIDIKQVREMEQLHARHLAEDSDTDRAMYRMQAEHAVALRCEEEIGYARGLHDGKRYWIEQFVTQILHGDETHRQWLRDKGEEFVVATDGSADNPGTEDFGDKDRC